jgi:hypothetical protein
MGARNVSAAYLTWPHLSHAAFRLLAGLALHALDSASDDRPARRAFLGEGEMVSLLGRSRTVMYAALTELREAGAVTVVRQGGRGGRAEYDLHLDVMRPDRVDATERVKRPDRVNANERSPSPLASGQGERSASGQGERLASGQGVPDSVNPVRTPRITRGITEEGPEENVGWAGIERSRARAREGRDGARCATHPSRTAPCPDCAGDHRAGDHRDTPASTCPLCAEGRAA